MKKDYIYYGIFALIVLYIVYNMFTSEGRKAKKSLSDLSKMNVFTDKYFQYLKSKYSKKWKDKYIRSLINTSRQIYDAKGLFKDNDSKAISAIRGIQSKTELALVNKVMSAIYKEDLPTYISFLDDNNINDVVYILNRLPEYAEPSGKDYSSDDANESNIRKVLKYFGL